MNNTVASFEPTTDMRVSDEAIAAYQRDGVICLRGALDKPWLEVVEEGISQYFRQNQLFVDDKNVAIKHQGDKGKFYYATLMWKELEPFRKVIFDSPAASLFGSLLQTKTLNLYYDFLLIKEAGCNKAVTPWHQDHSYYCLNGRKIINCWIALDGIPKETSLRFVRGSHNHYEVHQAVHFSPDKEYVDLIKERPLPPNFKNDETVEILSCDLQPGDALVWNSRTFHSAPGNTLDQRRAALSLNFCGDDVTYFDMAQEADPPIRGENLVDGSEITCDSFPLLRQ
ncbi:MAG: ectoine hydroxylase-related dioxygenase (phytanoyl-CoA dioxygenase family) [Saprospiraceae bacterium]|jgi:ectoine hydroxylase-related dioxygenase (phytanoyl-CoA dioxygenase family)